MDSQAIASLDLALRAGLVAMVLFVAAVLLREHPRHLAARLGAVLGIGIAAYAVQTLAGFANPPHWWQGPVLALSAGNAVVFWLFSRALFDDEFKPKAWHGLAWLALAAAPVVNCFVLAPTHHASARTLGMGINLVTLGFSALAVGQTLSTWRTDLVERRRRLRIFIVGSGAAYTALATFTRLAAADGAPSAVTGIVDMLVLGAIVVAIGWQLLRVSGGEVFGVEVHPGFYPGYKDVVGEWASPSCPDPAAQDVAPACTSKPSMDPADSRLIARLDHAMTVERFHRKEDVSIGALAAHLDMPEYRLRKLINQQLGHRNFNAFLNCYRLTEAKAALADPARSEVPVLTIAMDAGFQSLGPFNRAFKADTGLTPTEFRRLGWPKTPAESRIPLADIEIG